VPVAVRRKTVNKTICLMEDPRGKAVATEGSEALHWRKAGAGARRCFVI
jgi:hypothetical protein